MGSFIPENHRILIKTTQITYQLNRGAIWHLSIEKLLNVSDMLIDSDRENNSLHHMILLSTNLIRVLINFQVKNGFEGLQRALEIFLIILALLKKM